MNWQLSHRKDPQARQLADRHYNRQSVGASDFVPPGRCLVLVTPDSGAFWVSSWPFAEYVKHEWAGAWMCTAFRREHGALASELIRQAVACTRWKWGNKKGGRLKRRRIGGYCYFTSRYSVCLF